MKITLRIRDLLIENIPNKFNLLTSLWNMDNSTITNAIYKQGAKRNVPKIQYKYIYAIIKCHTSWRFRKEAVFLFRKNLFWILRKTGIQFVTWPTE